MSVLHVGDVAYLVVDPLPEFGLEVLRTEFLPAEQMGVIHPHAWEWLIAIVARMTDSIAAGPEVSALDAAGGQAVFDQVIDLYSRQLDAQIAEAAR